MLKWNLENRKIDNFINIYQKRLEDIKNIKVEEFIVAQTKYKDLSKQNIKVEESTN